MAEEKELQEITISWRAMVAIATIIFGASSIGSAVPGLVINNDSARVRELERRITLLESKIDNQTAYLANSLADLHQRLARIELMIDLLDKGKRYGSSTQMPKMRQGVGMLANRVSQTAREPLSTTRSPHQSTRLVRRGLHK
jgi:hypothetical protein